MSSTSSDAGELNSSDGWAQVSRFDSSLPSMHPRPGVVVIVLLFVAIAVARIASTYDVFSHTYDEPSHVARGMEWLTKGSYSYVDNPPLAPVFQALGPYLDGVRIEFSGDKWRDGSAIVYARDSYERNLTLARIGTLPFFLLASVCVWWWSRKLFGDAAALAATALFTTLPPVLAHAGLATIDMAITATLACALLTFTSWLDRPTPARGAALGAAAGLALLSKFSVLVFLPVGALAIVAVRWLANRRQAVRPVSTAGGWAKSLGLGASIALAMLWGGYRFSVGAATAQDPWLYQKIAYVLGVGGPLHDIVNAVAAFPGTPAPEYLMGIISLSVQEVHGFAPYFLGELRHNQGSWLYFPVALGVKSPLAFTSSKTPAGVTLCPGER